MAVSGTGASGTTGTTGDDAPPDAGSRADGYQIVTVLPPSPDGASFEAWRRFLSFACSADLVDPADAPAFHAEVRIQHAGPFMVSEAIGSHGYRCVRTAEDVVRSGVDHVLINLHVVGSYQGVCGGRQFWPRPGAVSCYTFAQPYDFTLSPHRVVALMIPRSHLPERLRDRDLHGLVAPAQGPLTGLLASALVDVFAALPSLDEAAALAAVSAIVALAEAVFTGTAGKTAPPPTPAELALFGRAQALIEDGLGDRALSAQTLARRLKVSRTALYAVFADAGGIHAYIRERRLQRCYELLCNASRRDETLGAIAASQGFASEATFAKLFKDRFGVTPGRMRAVAKKRGVAVSPAKAIGVTAEPLRSLGR